MIFESADTRKGTNERKVGLKRSCASVRTYCVGKPVHGTVMRRVSLRGSLADLSTYAVWKRQHLVRFSVGRVYKGLRLMLLRISF